jgi:hypothetical protein
LIDAAIKAETKRRKKSKRANERGESSRIAMDLIVIETDTLY